MVQLLPTVFIKLIFSLLDKFGKTNLTMVVTLESFVVGVNSIPSMTYYRLTFPFLLDLI